MAIVKLILSLLSIFDVISTHKSVNEADIFITHHNTTNSLNEDRRSTNRQLLYENYETWISPKMSYLPRQNYLSAIASYSDSILLLGGAKYKQQLVRFDITSQTIKDLGNNTLSVNIWGQGQYYTQMDQILFWIDSGSDGQYILLYNLMTNTILPYNITIPYNVGGSGVGTTGCLASYNDILYVVGGYYPKRPLNSVQIYNISVQLWELGPGMQTARRRLSCIVHHQHLYAIGGQTSKEYLKSIEMILINNISNNQWKYIHNMSNPWSLTRAVKYRDCIFIIGGRGKLDDGTYLYLSELLIINSTSNQISSGGHLNYAIFGTSAIVSNEVIYAFGGSSAEFIYHWQYLDLYMYRNSSVSSTANVPTTTSIDSGFTTDFTVTSISSMTDMNHICESQHKGYMNVTYETRPISELCDEGIKYIDFLEEFIHIVDMVYHSNDFIVLSTITNEQRGKFSTLTICHNITFHLITCFTQDTHENQLTNFTQSINFENAVIEQLMDNNYTIIIYVKNTTINIVTIHSVENNIDHIILISIVSGLLVCVCFIGTTISVICHRKQKLARIKNQVVIQNAMVILLAIGQYDEFPTKPDPKLENVILPDLDVSNIDKDIKQLYRLFGPENLNYCIYPRYKNINNPRTRWTQQQILAFLKKRAAQFDNSDEFDALIVIFSAHGISNHICTTDYQLIEKTVIHRLFTSNYYKSRDRVRVFMFDCCDGDESCGGYFEEDFDEKSPLATEMTKHIRTLSVLQINSDEETGITDENDEVNEEEAGEQNDNIGKSVQMQDIKQKHDVLWPYYTRGPDYKLVQINAANPGFQSKIDSRFGSHMLYQFAEKTLDDLIKHNGESSKYIHEIFDEIQKELHDNRKQHIVTTYNDQSRYIQFKTKSNGL